MRDIATATLSGNLTREVELRVLPSGTEVARLRVASGARQRSGEEWVERTKYFTVEIYGPQAHLCAERLGRGSRVVVDGEFGWRNGPTTGRTDARLSYSGLVRSCSSAPARPRRQTVSPTGRTIRRMRGPIPQPKQLHRQARTTCRSDQAHKRLARPSTDGRAARPPAGGGFLFALMVDPARAVETARKPAWIGDEAGCQRSAWLPVSRKVWRTQASASQMTSHFVLGEVFGMAGPAPRRSYCTDSGAETRRSDRAS
jgi:single stranded DNA-binding protein